MRLPMPSWLSTRCLTLILLATAAIGWGVLASVESWWFRSEFTQAEREASRGRFEPARDRLAKLSSRWPGRAEVEYLLGGCEASLGHVEAAFAAWDRVPPGSHEMPFAQLELAKLSLAHGRLATAETGLARVLDQPGEIGEEAAQLADQLDLYLGRTDEIARRIEKRWTKPGGNSLKLLRTHWLLETQPFPIEDVGKALGRMANEAPEDDRVWLGLAQLATRSGRYEEADTWLKRCETKRPDDHLVARTRLDWALATGRLDLAQGAAGHLPASRFTAAELATLTARLAALRGDTEAERRALEEKVSYEPGDASAWGRLRDLAAGSGRTDTMTVAARRKAEIDRVTDEYRLLMAATGTSDPAKVARMAQMAEKLGRVFEARGWWSSLANSPETEAEARAALARLAQTVPPANPGATGKSLADLLPSLAKVPASVLKVATTHVPKFSDNAETAGLRFIYENDQTPLRRLPETMGGGVGLIDYDGDGRMDVYAVQGGHFPTGLEGESGGDRLFRNKGDGTFEDVTIRSGIASFRRAYGHGVAVGDYDNDGHPDLFVTRWRAYALYRNKGDGTFEDATDRAGLGGSRGWPTSSGFADLDNDGDLDLYVCQYLAWDPETSPPCPDQAKPGRHLYCVPRAFQAEQDRVFRNDNGKFTDVTAQAGIVDKDGRGLGVVLADLDGDGRTDIYVANDMTANFLFRNLGGFRFEEVGEASGAASNSEGGYQAGMGVACGDVDGDGRPDLAVTNFYGESTTLFLNLGRGLFADRSAAANLAAPSRYLLGFGAAFLDANNDGRLDLATANGHVNDYSPAIPYAMPAQLYFGIDGGRFAELSSRAGGCWQTPRVGRGLAVGDLDNDGRQDLVILSQGGPLAYFRNLGTGAPGSGGGHSITLRLEGRKSNRDGVGAVVRVTALGQTQTAQRFGGGSFLSASDGRLHFGLGYAAVAPAASVEIHWPSGQVDSHQNLVTNAGYRLVEGETSAKPLEGGFASPAP